MSKSRNLVAVLQEEAGNLFYQSSDLTENERLHLLFLWNNFPEEALADFVSKNEALLLAKLTHSDKILSDDAHTPWNEEDMNAYYILSPSDNTTNINLYERRKLLRYGFPLTIHDDLQLSRKHSLHPDEERCFKRLELLSEARAMVDPTKSSKQHYLNNLFALLSFYRSELNEACEKEKEADPPYYLISVLPVTLGVSSEKKRDYVFPQRKDITDKIDWITRSIAMYMDQIIFDQETDKYSEDLKEIFVRLGHLKDEVLPWLSMMGYGQLFKFKRANAEKHTIDKNIKKYINSFIAFHTLLSKECIAKSQLESVGSNFAAFIRQTLQNDLSIANGVCSKNLDKTLINIKHYLKKSQVSPWVMLQISESLKNISKTPIDSPLGPEMALIVYQYVERIQQDQIKLQESHQNLLSLNQDDYTPALKIALLKSRSFDQAVKAALDSNFLPPSASLFYAMFEKDAEHCKKIMIELAEKHPAVLHETLQHIFSDETYEDEHAKLLDSGIHPSITQTHYPLFALRRAYQPQTPLDDESLCRLWVQFIDSGMMMDADFFAKENNQKLFNKLEPLSEKVISLLSFESKKTFASGLAFYRATQLEMSFFKPCVIRLPGLGSGMYYKKESDWAEKCLSDMLNQVAYPDGSSHINFDNIIRFLSIDFCDRSEPSRSLENLEEQITLRMNEFFALNQHISKELFFKFNHVFFQLYQKNQSSVETAKRVYVETFIRDLPTLCVALLGVMQKPKYVAMPKWFSESLRMNIEGTMLQSQIQAQLFQQLRVLTDAIKASHFALETEDPLSHCASMLNFSKQLYLAYCKQSVAQNREGDWNRVLQMQAQKDMLQPDRRAIHTLLDTIKQALEMHHDQVLQHSQWLQIGYNREESQAQLDHFKKIYHEMIRNDFSNLATCHKLLQHITDAVTHKTFKRSFWLSNFYHDYLVQLQAALIKLEDRIINISSVHAASEPMMNTKLTKRLSKSEESIECIEPSENKKPKVSVVNSRCSLYAEQKSPASRSDDERERLSHMPF